ncbi:MAG: hypothetical protein HY825_19010 [Acidobacteria bacterium]|nr:hypothetical protein [Acidobacteriota bacterium]
MSTYYWTKKDEVVAQGGIVEWQGPFVTPYGIRPEDVPNVRTLRASENASCDIDRSRCVVPWRVDRFSVGDASPYYWRLIPTLPPELRTFEQLFAYLIATDEPSFPASLYAPAKLRAPLLINTANTIFDHWSNSEFRALATAADEQVWRDYGTNPGAMPLRAGGKRIRRVLALKRPVPPILVKPTFILSLGAFDQALQQSATPDQKYADILTYAAELEHWTSMADKLFETSRSIMRRRAEPIRLLQALRALAEATTTFPAPSTGGDIMAKIDDLGPKVEERLLAIPVATVSLSNLPSSVPLTLFGYADADGSKTLDAGESLELYRRKLTELLHDNAAQVETFKSYLRDRATSGQSSDDVAELVVFQRLADALNAATRVLGEIGPADGELERLNGYLLGLQDDGHADPSAVATASPLELLMKAVGKPGLKTLKFPKALDSLRVAVAEVSAKWALATLASDLPDLLLRSDWESQLKPLADRITSLLPSGSALRAELEAAVASGKPGDLLDKRAKFAWEVSRVAKAELSARGTCALAALDVLGLIIAFREHADSPNKGVLLETIAVSRLAVDTMKVTLGTYKAVVKGLVAARIVCGTSTALAGTRPSRWVTAVDSKWFTKGALVVGALSGVAAVASGVGAFVEAIAKGDTVGIATTTLDVAAGVGTIATSIVAIWELTLPVVNAISVACALVSGLIKFVKAAVQGGNGVNDAAHELVGNIRSSTAWVNYCRHDPSLASGLDELDRLCGAKLPVFPLGSEEQVFERLSALGFSRDAIAAMTAQPVRADVLL